MRKRRLPMQYGKEWLHLVNSALSMVSADLMEQLDDGTLEASYVDVLLPTAVDEVYATVDFYDIAKTEELPRSNKPHPVYRFCYKRPENAAKILSIRTIPCDMDWELSEGMVCTDACRVICQYVNLPDTPDDMPSYARNLVTLKLAALLAAPLTHDNSLAQVLESKHTQALSNVINFSFASRYQEDRSAPYWTAMGDDD